MSVLESGEMRIKREERRKKLTRVRESARPKVRARRKEATKDSNNTSSQEDVEVRVDQSEPRPRTDRGTVSGRR